MQKDRCQPNPSRQWYSSAPSYDKASPDELSSAILHWRLAPNSLSAAQWCWQSMGLQASLASELWWAQWSPNAVLHKAQKWSNQNSYSVQSHWVTSLWTRTMFAAFCSHGHEPNSKESDHKQSSLDGKVFTNVHCCGISLVLCRQTQALAELFLEFSPRSACFNMRRWHLCNLTWLVVSTPLKNICQLRWLFPIYGEIKNVPNHQPVTFLPCVMWQKPHAKPRWHVPFLTIWTQGGRQVSLVTGLTCSPIGSPIHLFTTSWKSSFEDN